MRNEEAKTMKISIHQIACLCVGIMIGVSPFQASTIPPEPCNSKVQYLRGLKAI